MVSEQLASQKTLKKTFDLFIADFFVTQIIGGTKELECDSFVIRWQQLI